MSNISTKQIEVNEDHIGALFAERCKAWLRKDSSDIEREAAFHEFINAVLDTISINGTDPAYRHEVLQQARSTIDYYLEQHVSQVATFVIGQFQNALTSTLLDRQYGNSLNNNRSDLQIAREGVRLGFHKIIEVKITDSSKEEILKGEDEFLREIKEKPSRKVFQQYADWLELHGGIRGEYVKIRRILSRKPKNLKKKQIEDLRERQWEIRSDVDHEWGLDNFVDPEIQKNGIPALMYNEDGLPWHVRLPVAIDLDSQIQKMIDLSSHYPTISSLEFNWKKDNVASERPLLRPVLDALGKTRIHSLNGCENFIYTTDDLRHPYMGRTVNIFGARPAAINLETWQKMHGNLA